MRAGGGKLLNLYFTLGQHDFPLVSEMPDARAVSVISLAAAGRRRLPGRRDDLGLHHRSKSLVRAGG
jgi:GYD domain